MIFVMVRDCQIVLIVSRSFLVRISSGDLLANSHRMGERRHIQWLITERKCSPLPRAPATGPAWIFPPRQQGGEQVGLEMMKWMYPRTNISTSTSGKQAWTGSRRNRPKSTCRPDDALRIVSVAKHTRLV